jgi:hypothetical protein
MAIDGSAERIAARIAAAADAGSSRVRTTIWAPLPVGA